MMITVRYQTFCNSESGKQAFGQIDRDVASDMHLSVTFPVSAVTVGLHIRLSWAASVNWQGSDRLASQVGHMVRKLIGS